MYLCDTDNTVFPLFVIGRSILTACCRANCLLRYGSFHYFAVTDTVYNGVMTVVITDILARSVKSE